jgi:DNA-binding NtrC family response regulator
MSKGYICIIDDEPDMVETCADILKAQDYKVDTTSNASEGLQLVHDISYDIVLVDLMMPKVDGMQILSEAKKVNPATIVILFTGYPTIESAVSAMKNGAFDYLVKPFMASQLISVIDRAMTVKKLQGENRDLKQKLALTTIEHPFIGTSPAIHELLNSIKKVAPLESNVLITGESGTGKELAAVSIHRNSKRKDHPFVPINCSALPEPLLESELFGHEKGSFTGATSKNIGLFEFAEKGTLFLDEIGELPLALQVKLLRVVQEREVRRVGGKEQIPIDVRLIAATNRDLEAMVREGKFREDLFFRLNVIRLKVPPLRERTEDITLLAKHFLVSFNEMQKTSIQLAPEAIIALKHYGWPGNVRELENAVHQGASMTESLVIESRNLPEAISRKASVPSPEKSADIDMNFNNAKTNTVTNFEKQYIISMLEKSKGNISMAAEASGMHRSSFQRLIRKYQINPSAIKGALIVEGNNQNDWSEEIPDEKSPS